MRIPDYADDPKRIHLYLNQATKFIILKKMDSTEYDRKDFYRVEYEAHDFYIKKEWEVLSSHNYNPTSEYKQVDTFDNLIERYRKAVNHMTYMLATINTKHTNSSYILNSMYKKVDKYFNTDLQSREGKNSLHKLTREELEYIMLELYPRFYHKRLDTLRDEYKHIKLPDNLFNLIK